jgi:hypothetical protein
MSRGIYLVANRRSERSAANLVYSIRASGCTAPIGLIPYDDDGPTLPALRAATTFMPLDSFPAAALALLDELRAFYPRTSAGLLRRFLAFYGPYEEFIYTDNDIVALGNWDAYFESLTDADLVHADEEYRTGGKYNYLDPAALERELGADALDSQLTAGHFAARQRGDITSVFQSAMSWIRAHPGIAREHDQAFLHLAVLLGPLRAINLCRPPHNWRSTWAGDYRNSLAVVQAAQGPGRLLHLHYSGGTTEGYAAREDFNYADCTDAERMRRLTRAALLHRTGLFYLQGQFLRGLKRRLRR